jgi:hypothetical protein
MRSVESTQFSVDISVKDRLDRYKAENKEEIIARLKARRRLVTNSMVIQYLLDVVGAKR